MLILSDKVEDLCIFISIISILSSRIIHRTKISAIEINGQITEGTGGRKAFTDYVRNNTQGKTSIV
jgi:hypothetical protein